LKVRECALSDFRCAVQQGIASSRPSRQNIRAANRPCQSGAFFYVHLKTIAHVVRDDTVTNCFAAQRRRFSVALRNDDPAQGVSKPPGIPDTGLTIVYRRSQPSLGLRFKKDAHDNPASSLIKIAPPQSRHRSACRSHTSFVLKSIGPMSCHQLR